MGALLSILIILTCVLLVLVVLVQNSKGGGISSNFSSANQIMGVKRGADFIEKATWILALSLFLFSLLSAPRVGDGSTPTESTESVTRKKAEGAVPATQQPTTTQPTQQPAPTK